MGFCKYDAVQVVPPHKRAGDTGTLVARPHIDGHVFVDFGNGDIEEIHIMHLQHDPDSTIPRI